MNDNKKKKIIWGIVIPVLIIAIAVVAIATPLLIGYYKNAYESQDAVERLDEYVEPTLDPELWGIEETTETSVEETTSPQLIEKPGYDYLISFGDSKNALSVFGRTPIYKKKAKNPDILNILVLGTDSRDVTKSRGRSDSIIILSYNRKTDEIKMVSILRDSLVPIEGHNWNRINAAYSFDGVGLAVNTVNQLFNLDIQHFVVIDFNGARHFVDKVGGVDINLTQKEANFYNRNNQLGDMEIPVGRFHMNGEQALAYMRTRYVDSDFKRTERQRKVITTLANKILNEKSITEIYGLTEYAFTLVKTNISMTDFLSIVSAIASDKDSLSIESQHVPYSDAFSYKSYNGMSIISFDIGAAATRVNKFLYNS